MHSKLEQLIEDFISTFFFNRQGLLTPILYFHRPAVDGAIISQVGSYQYLQKAHFFIDGFPSEDGMSSLDPAEIETIDILKDASSNAIYGARGAIGVFVITTKSGANK